MLVIHCSTLWRDLWVVSEGVGVVSVEKKGRARECAAWYVPGTCGLRAQTIEYGRNGDGMVCRGHFGSGLCAVGCYDFTFGVPAAVERIEVGLLTCGLMSRPPVSKLLVPALGISGAADTDMGSPDGGVPIGVHRDLLYFLSTAIFSCVRFD